MCTYLLNFEREQDMYTYNFRLNFCRMYTEILLCSSELRVKVEWCSTKASCYF